jgi:membrane protein
MYLIKCRKALIVLFIVFLNSILFSSTHAQRIAIKTNALEYLVLSPNLSLEARLSRKLSVQLEVGGCPITRPVGGIKLSNFRVEPELRYWFNRPMARHFVALSATAGSYSLRLKERYFTGDVIGAGVSYGYALVLSDHWNMEAEIGLGLASLKGYNYKGANNVPEKKNFSRIYPVPIRVGLTFAYVFN